MSRVGMRRCVASMWLCCAFGLASQAAAQTGAAVPGASDVPASVSAGSAALAPSDPSVPSAETSASTPASAPDVSAPAAAVLAPPAGLAAQVEQPRAYGHVIGDVLRQRILLPPPYAAADPARLPPPGRVGVWLERRAPRLENDTDARRWLVLDYQIINAPQTPITTALPAVGLRVGSGPLLVVAAWPVGIGPLIPTTVATTDAAAGGLPLLQPDRRVAPIPTAALQRHFAMALAATAISAAAWAGWWAWRRWRDRRRLPFDQAWHALAPMRRAGALSAQPAAWRRLHHALNATAGRVIHRDTLARLFDAAPHLRTVQRQLEAFYAGSAERFFVHPDSDAPADAQQADALWTLARTLRTIERQHAR